MKKIFITNNDWTGFILRVIIGLVMLPHGAQKLFGWFGGYGFSGTMQFFTETKGLPWIVGFAVIMIEFFGSILLLLGLGSRILAVFFIILAAGIALSSHIQNGFFTNLYGNQAGEGFEFFILLAGLNIALLLNGSGKLSIDSRVNKRQVV
jgi:putative oxidoreductase